MSLNVKAANIEHLTDLLLGRVKPESKERPQSELFDAAHELATRVDRLLRAVASVESHPYAYTYSWHLDTDKIKEILSDDLC